MLIMISDIHCKVKDKILIFCLELRRVSIVGNIKAETSLQPTYFTAIQNYKPLLHY